MVLPNHPTEAKIRWKTKVLNVSTLTSLGRAQILNNLLLKLVFIFLGVFEDNFNILMFSIVMRIIVENIIMQSFVVAIPIENIL